MMAPCDDEEFCGHCNKVFKGGDLSVNCDLYCAKWFHIKCINISKSDHEKMKALIANNKWFCLPCEQVFKKYISRKDESKDVCCECFNYICILTDSIKDLTDNQREMSVNLNKLHDER